jgi:Tfp pilus assembly protein FimT
MKIISAHSRRAGYTLIELMFAISAALTVTGAIVLLMVQAGLEQRKGLASATVEMKAHALESQIISCLRAKSVNQGIWTDVGTKVTDGAGNTLGYQAIQVSTPNSGGYITGRIQFNSAAGTVIYIPNVTSAATQDLWATNSVNSRLTKFYFSPSLNLDGSLNSSLVRVTFAMDDNGFSQQATNINPASVQRNFAVQLRND